VTLGAERVKLLEIKFEHSLSQSCSQVINIHIKIPAFGRVFIFLDRLSGDFYNVSTIVLVRGNFCQMDGSKKVVRGSGTVESELVRSGKKQPGFRTSKGNLLNQFLG